jgi:hypothetical protein
MNGASPRGLLETLATPFVHEANIVSLSLVGYPAFRGYEFFFLSLDALVLLVDPKAEKCVAEIKDCIQYHAKYPEKPLAVVSPVIAPVKPQLDLILNEQKIDPQTLILRQNQGALADLATKIPENAIVYAAEQSDRTWLPLLAYLAASLKQNQARKAKLNAEKAERAAKLKQSQRQPRKPLCTKRSYCQLV